MDHEKPAFEKEPISFQRKVWIAAGIVALLVVLIWFLKAIFSVLLLILTGALIAIYFRGLSGLIHRKLHVPEKGSLAISIIGTLLFIVAFFWLAGTKLEQQVNELSDTLPSIIDKVKYRIIVWEYK